ncbi:MFS transporter [Sulfitobacter guttiformis]|uniref:Putative MFS family arabinose efflux permease n=1 Tax=Sulfitobacter guttiformis TaxID=74349 RepID=A0A420DJW7_9RHOB|nr:MFS transporter [Sulfitobacter guttiformis]KIN71683.1 Permease of the major facilitator superfamily protein [Sulfitobacter guttiformis KCTC 32187]RKE94488.1 putative MFS family arabinose efflux permease [Sulfitobacter guttiformis]
MSQNIETRAFEVISGADGPAETLNEPAQKAEAANGLRHAVSLGMTKVADGLIDPKLVLSWLLTSLGAPAVYAGALVPIREAGALLPQILLAGWVQGMARRKWAWVAGSAGQGICAGLIVLAALTLEGAAAGLAICAALAVLALFRAICSVSYKDILGKTIGQSRRGSVTGLAGSLSSVGVLVFAGLLIAGVLEERGAVIAAIALAACLWGVAALVFSSIKEQPSEGASGVAATFSVLKDNPDLWRFIIVRGLLTATALAPPYFVIIGGGEDGGTLGGLGALLLASALASLLSSYVWGRLSDHSSRLVLMLTGVAGAVAMVLAVALAQLGLAQTVWAMPSALFVLMIAYHGVRQGRSTYLVDMAPDDQRAAYSAVSNTVIGVLLLVAGVAGGGAALFGPQVVLVLFAVMAVAAAVVAIGLPEAQDA